MRKRMNETQYKEFKATFVTLKKTGKNVSQIRDLLGIGNGTAAYIDQTETFADYCKLRDEVLHRSISAKKREESRLKTEAVKAAKATIDEPTPVVEAPVNVEKLIRSNMRDLREFLENEYADAIVARVVHAVAPETAEAPAGRTWYGTRKH